MTLMTGLSVPLDNLPSARVLSDLAAADQDLDFVINCTERLLTEVACPEPEIIVCQALWSAAVIAYHRCFGAGRHAGLHAKALAEMGIQRDVQEFHEYIRTLRNKQIAHLASPYEAARVGAVLALDGDPRVMDIGTVSLRQHLPDSRAVEQLKILAVAVQQYIHGKLEFQRALVLSDVKAMDMRALYDRANFPASV